MQVRILSGGAANGLVDALRKRFREEVGFDIQGDFGAVGGMRDRVMAGEPVDLVILTRAVVDELIDAEKVVAQSAIDIGEVVTGVAVRTGSVQPDVSTGMALKDALLGADAVFCPDTAKATAGIHFARILGDLGIADAMKPRLREFRNGQTAMSEMARSGEPRPLGCTQVTEILNTQGVDYAGSLPAPHDLSTTYTAAIATDAASPDAARALIGLLAAPDNAAIRRGVGFT